jgi:hypothetical protein
VSFALGLDGGVMLKLPLEQFHRLLEFWRVNLVPVLPMLLQEIIQPQLRGGPHGSLQTPTNGLAVNFDFAKIVPADNVLQQMRHFGKRAPFAVGGQVFGTFAETWLWILQG